MQHRSLTLGPYTLLVLALSAACSGDVSILPRDLPHAVSMFTCGPADGPAVRILIAEQPIANTTPTPPYVSLYIDRSVANLAPGAYSLPEIGANWWTSATAFEGASSGGIEITSVADDRTISGTVSLSFPSRTVTGPFVAPWRLSPERCV